ncbi:hypothetical protein NDN08_004778 [Rhodosorus marinus]|uniref:Uroporphyrinogen-III synthase n=1 Tax=Rhodosorus marinus TaxID=101924 RepID=A0AAV8UQA9_9RHOD|nr:hypothetical protein NDN08_004778 [Rhodosorus marinus]
MYYAEVNPIKTLLVKRYDSLILWRKIGGCEIQGPNGTELLDKPRVVEPGEKRMIGFHISVLSSNHARSRLVLTCQLSSREWPLVGLTRERGKNDKLAKLLGDRGIPYKELPCIEFVDGDDRPQLAGLLQGEWDWVVVTSPEAAMVLSEELLKADSRGQWKVASVGKATADVLRDKGISVSFTPSRATAEDLCKELPDPAGKVLFPASKLASETVFDRLSERGFSVSRINTYSTEPAQWDEEQKKSSEAVDIVAVGSPSALKGWIAQTGRVPHTTACIGGTSAKASKKQGVEGVFFPENPGVEGWVKSVEEACEHLRARQRAPSSKKAD